MVSQNGSQSTKRSSKSIPKQNRDLTPERPVIPGTDSRDELAKTASYHNGRRQKRLISELSDEDEESPSISPAKTKKTTRPSPDPTTLPKATKPPSLKPTIRPSLKPSATRPPLKPTATSSQLLPKSTYPPRKKPATAATQDPTEKTINEKVSAENTLQAGFTAGERSRSNSSTTLMPGSNAHSQSNSYSQMSREHDTTMPESNTPKKPTAKSKPKTTVAKTEAEAFNELNIISRRYYLTFLSHNYVDEPLRVVFPGMKTGHPTYKEARRRVQRSYKTWKSEMLKWALIWVQRWMRSPPSLERREMLDSLTTFAEIKAEIREEYDPKWLESVFRFGLEAVDFETITPDGLRFLKFAFLQMVTHSRMTELLNANPTNPALIKYTRQHLLDCVDALHLKSQFEDQTVDNYPERLIPRALQYKKRPKIDLNIDSDADMSDDDAQETEVEDLEEVDDDNEDDDVRCGNSG